jgi:hypothetical protein
MGPDASVGTAHDSGTASTSADAPTNVPVDAGTGADTSAHGGAGGAGGTTSTGGTTNTGGTTTTGGTPAAGGTTSTGGSTSSPPDAAVDSPAAADATTTPSQTVALFHFDSTTGLTDSSGTNKVATVTGNPVISTTQSKFGGASLYVNGNATVRTNYVRVPEDSDFNFPGDFTIDWWQYVVTYTNTWGGFVQIRSQAESDGNTCAYCAGSGWSGGGSSYQGIRWPADAVPAPTAEAWHHLALIRSGDLFLMFIDGKLVATDTAYSVTVHGILSITGQVVAGDNGDFNGYIDELRVVKGVAVWTSDFTPPTAPYTAADLLPPDGGVDVSTVDASLGDAVPQEQNLMLWLNAATITGLADGANVATWSDGSGNGRNVSAAGTPPTYRVNQMNGLPDRSIRRQRR